MFGLAFTTPPFSKAKFAAYMAGLTLITAVSLSPRATRPVPGASQAPQDAAAGPTFDLIRFTKSQDDIEDQWAAIGIPWFLRNAGVVGQADTATPHELTIHLTWQGQKLGHILEKTEAITPDRTRLYLAFVPDDMALVQRLAAPIDTPLDPLGLMRATLDEHLRSRLDGDDFNLEILSPDSLLAKLKRLAGADKDARHPLTDDPPPAEIDPSASGGDAAIEQAYRDEAKFAGANAPNL